MLSPTLRSRLDGPVRKWSGGRLYYAYTLRKAERVGSSPRTLNATRVLLMHDGYEQSPRLFGVPLEAAKLHPETGQVHDVSLRRVDPNRPACQWHIHLFAVDGIVEIFSHYELRPDFRPINGESLGEAIERLEEHKRPSWGSEWGDGTTYVLGKKCDVVAAMVD